MNVAVSIPALPPPPPGKTGWPWTMDATMPGLRATPEGSPASWPRISVVTPSFNQGDYLEETIRSVILQGYPNLQFIVVDGGSTDQSSQVIGKYAQYMSHVIEEPDEGQSDAICKGIDLVDGEWFNWINSDDMLMPGTLWELATQSRPSTDLYTFSVQVMGDANPYLMHNRNLSAMAMLRCDPYSFSQPGLWFRTERLRAIGGIDRQFNYGFDWDLLVRYLASNPKVVYSDSVGAMFRLHDRSKTVVETGKEIAADNRFEQESFAIRDKLERLLPPRLASASRLGRRRGPWHARLIEDLDDFQRSPSRKTIAILRDMMDDLPARCSMRSVMTMARLMSRYVRPSLGE